MVAYLKASWHEKTYSDYLWAVRGAEKEESMELSQNPWSQVIDNTAKPKTISFFPLQKLKGNQPVSKTGTRKWKLKTLTVLMGFQESSWCTLHRL